MNMHELPAVTDREWALLLELVQNELTELPSEMHHTVRRDYREELSIRRRTLEDLLGKLQAHPVA